MHSLINIITGIILTLTMAFNVWAGNLTIPNTFTSNTTAVASEVNANFTAVKTEVDDNNAQIAALEARIAALEAQNLNARIVVLEGDSVSGLGSVLTIDTDGNGYSRALFSGVNVQIINGTGSQTTADGTGNLIIGYNNARSTGASVCTDGQHTTSGACTGAGETWAVSHKSGSHNLVAGDENSYSQTGGIVFGYKNVINRDYANVSGGLLNISSGNWSSVSGGFLNSASGDTSSVSGGISNSASGGDSSVNGGFSNIASGSTSSVSGGASNTASGAYSSIGGGANNTTSGDDSSISGGDTNTASGIASSVAGGRNNTASHSYSSVSGGNGVSTAGVDDWNTGP